MKIKFGAIVTDGRGKLGGHVASKNRGGSYLRTKVTPSNPQTAFQSAVRAALGNFSAAWSGLTSAARESFNGAVAQWSKTDIFGDIKNPTGKNLFTRLNINLANTGQADISVAPDKVEILSIGATGAAFSIAATTALLDDAVNAAGSVVLVSATPPQSAGTSFYKGKYRDIMFAAAGTAATLDFWDAYVARFGVPALGANIGVSVKQVASNGQTTTPQSFVALVEA